MLGLKDVLSVSLQFGKMNTDDLAQLHKYDTSPEIEAIDNSISESVGETGKEGISYKFKVNYAFEKASKGESNIVFTENNKSSENVTTVLTKQVVGDDLWPHKPSVVMQRVSEATGTNFNNRHHMLAWKKYGARPRTKAKNPADCKKEFCHYHSAHRDYTYSEKWVEFLIGIVNDVQEFEKLKKFKPNT
ncbi:hypothetical protein C8024_06320 [Sphingopyxis sp. BSNA05]|nr:hypothetical protein [Sphingopyxis sp. BSNA05]NRD89148.1 hypothetical protein [Sphingopyxis sp. BSNA05]